MEDLLQLLPEPAFLVRPNGDILSANAAAAQFLGRNRSSLRGTSLRDLIEDDGGRVIQFLKFCAGSRALLPLVVRWRRENGSHVDCRCDAGLVSLDRESGLATVFLRCRSQNEAVERFAVLNEKIQALSSEIAVRRRAEEAMHHSEERYRTLVAATSTVVWSADASGRFTAFQPAWEAFTGQPSEEYTAESWLDALHKDDRERTRKNWHESVGEARAFDIEARVWQRQASAYRRCMLRAVPIRDGEEGEVKEWIGTLTDIEDQKKFEDQLRQAQRLESLGVLAGGVAHDFNNLLVGILGNASLALETISTSSPARLMLRDVVAASESAATLTRQLLAYAGKGRFLIEPIDISALIREISSLVQTSIARTVQLRLELAQRLPCIEADASQVQQLIMNLIINAAEAIGDQPGTVLVSTGMQDLDEQYINTVLAPEQIKPGRYVTLEVHDTGIGMSQETMAKIFDPFFTTKFTGRGLGLAAVLGIVRGHKGAMKVYSTLGKGTTFKVLFPGTTETKVIPVAPQAIEINRNDEGVLVIDDEQFVRRTAKSMLERYGYTVYVAENGREGVDLYRGLGDKVQAILLDMTMPVMSGAETFRELKSINPGIPVILSSGYNEVEAVQRFTGKGLAGFIQKPYSAAALASKIRTIIEEWKEQKKGNF